MSRSAIIILQVTILTLWKEEREMSYLIAQLKPMTIHTELLSELLFNSGLKHEICMQKRF